MPSEIEAHNLDDVDDPTPLYAVVGLSYAVRADLEPADRTLLLLLTSFAEHLTLEPVRSTNWRST